MNKAILFLLVLFSTVLCSTSFGFVVAGTLIVDVTGADLPDVGGNVTAWENRGDPGSGPGSTRFAVTDGVVVVDDYEGTYGPVKAIFADGGAAASAGAGPELLVLKAISGGSLILPPASIADGDWSLEMWLRNDKDDASPHDHKVAGFSSRTNPRYEFESGLTGFVGPDGSAFWYRSPDGADSFRPLWGSEPRPGHTWNYLCWVSNGTSLVLYVNGVRTTGGGTWPASYKTNFPTTGDAGIFLAGVPATSASLEVGDAFDLNGAIAAARLHSGVLGDADVLENYNAEKGAFGPPPPPPPTPTPPPPPPATGVEGWDILK